MGCQSTVAYRLMHVSKPTRPKQLKNAATYLTLHVIFTLATGEPTEVLLSCSHDHSCPLLATLAHSLHLLRFHRQSPALQLRSRALPECFGDPSHGPLFRKSVQSR